MTEADAEMEVLMEMGIARHRAERLVLASADVELPKSKVAAHKKHFAEFIHRKVMEHVTPADVLRARKESLPGDSAS